MKRNTFFAEIVISLALILLIILFLDPFMVWMPSVAINLIMVGVITAFAIFAGFVWKENARDEREQLHRMIAGRCAYIVGIAVLLAGMLYQAFSIHSVDPWLVVGITIMIITKLVGLAYAHMHQ